MRKIIPSIFLFGCLAFFVGSAGPVAASALQQTSDSAVLSKSQIRKLDRRVSGKIRKYEKKSREWGVNAAFDSLCQELIKLDGIEAAAWDRCVVKIAVYPGSNLLGVRYKVNNVEIERCYTIRIGEIKKPVVPWRRVKGMYNDNWSITARSYCPGFVAQQQELCEEFSL